MNGLVAAVAAAVWLGMLTALSPCPMATNIAAVSYVTRRLESPRRVLLAAILYTAGRASIYISLGSALVLGALRVPETANLLQHYLTKALGPLLIVVGLILLEVVPLPAWNLTGGDRLRSMADRAGMAGAFGLGAMFALSFCPVSAALFFGSLIPLALTHNSFAILPLVYGITTSLPVLALGIPLALGVRWVAGMFRGVQAIAPWMRRITAVLFVLVGIYESLRYIFGVL